MSREVAAIILSAGFSRRMGSLKPLLPLGDGTLLDRVISSYLQNEVDVYVVLGHRGEEVRAGVKAGGVVFIENPAYARGMFTSVQAGVRSLKTGCRRFFVAPVDIPLVSPATVSRLMSAADEHPESVIHPMFGGRRGHPVLLPARLVPAILRWHKPGGLKALLAGEPNHIDLAVPDANILFDVDTPADYEELLRRFERESNTKRARNHAQVST